MRKPANIFLGVISLFLVSTTRAELVFEQTAIELHPAIGDEKAVGHFKYQNKGDKPVAIKNVSTSCGCTAASAKQTAEPGEKSEVTATFNIGDRNGIQQKIITVTTDDPAHPMTQLHLTVFIPQLLDLKQALVSWQANEPPTPKKIIAQAKDPSVKNIEVTSSNPDFTVKVEPGSVAGEYAISVQPKQTDKTIGSTLTIKPVLNNGVVKNFYATARIMPPLTPPSQAGAPAANTAGSPDETSVALNNLDACSLLTSEDIESIEGEPLKMSKRSSNASDGLINSQCYFGLPTTGNSISLVITQRAETADAHDPKQLWNETFHHDQREEKKRGEVKRAGQEEAPSAKKIDGVGEEAFWQGNRFGGALYVLKGGNIVRISVGGAGDEAAKIEKSKKLAQIVLKRL